MAVLAFGSLGYRLVLQHGLRGLFALTLAIGCGPAHAGDEFLRGGVAPEETTTSPSLPRTVQSDRMIAAFRKWAGRWKVVDASFAVMSGTTLLGTSYRGRYRPNTAVPVASLSKAITGACIAKLVDERRIGYATRLGTALASYLAANPPADMRVAGITVGQLLTHSSGITNDVTQGRFPPGLNFKATNQAAILKSALSAQLGSQPGTSYFYNNVNYVALGLIIEGLAGGASYETYCMNRVLKPLGIRTAALNVPWRIMGAYGGWRISAVDYAKFLRHLQPGSGLIKIPLSKWPAWRFSDGASYSIGTLYRPSQGAYNFWHAGSWRWIGAPYDASFGAYYVIMRNQIRYVANYAPTISSDALSDLDRSMWIAAFP